MKQIDKLLIKARTAANKSPERLIIAYVYTEGDIWIARGDLWRGVPGKGYRSVYEECPTNAAAVEAALGMANQFSPGPDFRVLVDDLEPDE